MANVHGVSVNVIVVVCFILKYIVGGGVGGGCGGNGRYFPKIVIENGGGVRGGNVGRQGEVISSWRG